ncbi:MAG TPA: methyltransferase domain-containing protein [Acidimicrobiales bacterium]|nr:methyltransferase domain-containing protein [Acidimicrobiales bacterium]
MRTPGWKQRAYRVLDRFVPTVPFRYLGPKQSVRMAFNVILDREPDATGGTEYTAKLAHGELSRHGVAQALAHSEEFRRQVPIADVLLSMHVSRSAFVAGLPRAARILDLGGTHQGFPDGALVHLGYPYPFERLVVVDLPVAERHEIYQGGSLGATVVSELGPVAFAFHSMVDLGPYADGSFDLVYSGQSIEHVTEAEGDDVMREVFRVLAPGGWFCLDTPNGPVWRLRSSELMNDDHKIEYGAGELAAKLRAAGFEVTESKGLNLMRRGAAAGTFDEAEASAHPGVFAAAEDCLLLALVARKPAMPESAPAPTGSSSP